MIVMVQRGFDPASVRSALVERGLWVRRYDDGEQCTFFVEPQSASVDPEGLRAIEGVASVATDGRSRPRLDAHGSVARVAEQVLGPMAPPVIMAGPCSVESEAQMHAIAARLAPLGVALLRGGAFKPRTSPYTFQGHGLPALRMLREAADAHGMGVVTELMDPTQLDEVATHADLVQIGSRNMHNYALLKGVGAAGRPVLLKRGMAATVEEWLNAAEYCLAGGAPSVIFCERGVRGFDPSTRNVLDLGAVALLRHVYHLPVIVDPSHAVGRRDLVPALARAGLAAGACGLMLETHDAPGEALSDGTPGALAPSDRIAFVGAPLRLEERCPRLPRATHREAPALTPMHL